MIPRTKVNYRLSDLLRAARSLENRETNRQSLSAHLAALFGVSHVLLTASGRGALYILLSSLPQKRVLIPAYTCKAVVEAASLAGKEILYGESQADGFNMATDELKNTLDPDTILVATHQFGIPCDIETMVRIAKEKGSFVIEDAAASLGTRIGGQLTGSFGDAAFFSFDSTKLVNVPLKAGFLLVRNPDLFARCQAFAAKGTAPMPFKRKLRYLLLGGILVLLEQHHLYRLFHTLKFGWRNRFTDDNADLKPTLGPFFSDRMAEWQAAVLLPQIKGLDQIVSRRRFSYAEYLRRLQGMTKIELPPADNAGQWAPIRFPVRVKGDKLAYYRQAARLGVDFAFSFTFIASPGQFIHAHGLAGAVLDLPFYHNLTQKELEKVAYVLKRLDNQDFREC